MILDKQRVRHSHLQQPDMPERSTKSTNLGLETLPVLSETPNTAFPPFMLL